MAETEIYFERGGGGTERGADWAAKKSEYYHLAQREKETSGKALRKKEDERTFLASEKEQGEGIRRKT